MKRYIYTLACIGHTLAIGLSLLLMGANISSYVCKICNNLIAISIFSLFSLARIKPGIYKHIFKSIMILSLFILINILPRLSTMFNLYRFSRPASSMTFYLLSFAAIFLSCLFAKFFLSKAYKYFQYLTMQILDVLLTTFFFSFYIKISTQYYIDSIVIRTIVSLIMLVIIYCAKYIYSSVVKERPNCNNLLK